MDLKQDKEEYRKLIKSAASSFNSLNVLEGDHKEYFKLVERAINKEILPVLKNNGIDISDEHKPVLFRYVKKSIKKMINDGEFEFSISMTDVDVEQQGEDILEIDFGTIMKAKVTISLEPIEKVLFFGHPEQCSLIREEILRELYGADYKILEEIKRGTNDILNKFRYDKIISKKQRGYKKIIGNEFNKLYKAYKVHITKSNFSKYVLPMIRDCLNIKKEEWRERKFIDYI